ncbi:MAG: hypothetical protein U0804_28790 [Gemmataceae bacterium]
MEALLAEELLASPAAAKLSPSQIRAAVLVATGDEEKARKAFGRRAADVLDADQVPR